MFNTSVVKQETTQSFQWVKQSIWYNLTAIPYVKNFEERDRNIHFYIKINIHRIQKPSWILNDNSKNTTLK